MSKQTVVLSQAAKKFYEESFAIACKFRPPVETMYSLSSLEKTRMRGPVHFVDSRGRCVRTLSDKEIQRILRRAY